MYEARLHAYCWMSNHLHFLVQVGDRPLSNVIRQIASGYARAFQAKLETTGHLFERRYHAVLVDADSYLLELLRYIHQNPVRARLVQRTAQYRWSSHHAYAGDTQEEWLTTDFALSMFSQDRRAAHAAYRRFIDEFDSTSADTLFAESATPIVGDAAFKSRVIQDCGATPIARPSLAALLNEACRMFGVTELQLRSVSRRSTVIRARAWFASQATSQGVATLAAVARILGKDRATLRHAMRRHASADD